MQLYMPTNVEPSGSKWEVWYDSTRWLYGQNNQVGFLPYAAKKPSFGAKL